jgi:alpha-tubulin suppressor-like RCC1 family protein
VAVRADKTLWTWGANGNGQLGGGTTTGQTAPVQVGGATDWQTVSAGNWYSTGIRTDGSLWAWGFNNVGQLGYGSWAQQTAPVPIQADTRWQSVSASMGINSHTVGVRSDGSLWAWGNNAQGRLGDGTTTTRNSPVRIGEQTGWASAAAGNAHTVALREDGSIWVWGDARSGQLGNDFVPAHTPTHIQPGTGWLAVSAGQTHTAGIRDNGTLWAWGNNADSRLGDGTTTGRSSPVQIGEASNWTYVSAGDTHTVALRADNTLWAWGSNANGRTGLGAIGGNTTASPTQVQPGTTWRAVSAGGSHTMAIAADGSLWGWGANASGQLGDTTNGLRSSPVRIDGPSTDWLAVSAGGNHTIAVRTDGSIWVWGSGDHGRLGTGNTAGVNTPTRIEGTSTDWQTVSAGGSYTLAVRTGGTLWAWGWNGDGRLGDGTTTDRHSPVQAGTATDWQTVSAGVVHSAGIRTDGSLWTWGENAEGSRLGDGTTTGRNAPAQIQPGTTWQTVSASWGHTAGIMQDGSLWAWGGTEFGQVGNGTTSNSTVPIPVTF